jgi:hypothetical protein
MTSYTSENCSAERLGSLNFCELKVLVLFKFPGPKTLQVPKPSNVLKFKNLKNGLLITRRLNLHLQQINNGALHTVR